MNLRRTPGIRASARRGADLRLDMLERPMTTEQVYEYTNPQDKITLLVQILAGTDALGGLINAKHVLVVDLREVTTGEVIKRVPIADLCPCDPDQAPL